MSKVGRFLHRIFILYPRRWRYSSLYDRLPISTEELDAILRQIDWEERRRWFRFWRLQILSLIAFALACTMLVITGQFAFVQSLPRWTQLPIFAGWLLITLALLKPVLRWEFSRRFRRIARSRGHEVCAACGYWLSALGSDSRNCPECGAAREAMPAAESPQSDV